MLVTCLLGRPTDYDTKIYHINLLNYTVLDFTLHAYRRGQELDLVVCICQWLFARW
jgi:hypothetical protein